MVENQTVKDRLILYIKHLGTSQRQFEIKCELANGYIKNIRQSITPDKLRKIALYYPELNTGWLMTGEGEMLKSGISQDGENNTQVIGDGNHVNAPNTLDKALDEIAAQRRLVEKSQEQIDRLIGVLEKLTEK